MEFLFVSMVVGFLLLMGKNEELRFVQMFLHTIAFHNYLEFIQTIFWLVHFVVEIQTSFMLRR